MHFNKICIIGTGLIGASLALAFKRTQVGNTVVGVDRKNIVERILDQGVVDEAYEVSLMEKGIVDADLIILSTNIMGIMHYLKPVAGLAKEGAIITDVGSSKEKIVIRANREFQQGSYFIGGHPMAGSEKAGLEAADPYLFENCFYILTPTENTPQDVLNSLVLVLETIGAKVLILDATTHDKIAAAISHLPQMLAVCLVNFMDKYNHKQPYYLKLAAGGFRDMTRIASSPFSMWQDICETNAENIVDIIDEFIVELEEFKKDFSPKVLEGKFNNAAKVRLSIPKDTKGFIHPNFDITVVVEDKPGIIAKISSTLAEKNINIRDIEVLKVRLLEGGTMRLSFESEKDREKALLFLQEKGFDCKKR